MENKSNIADTLEERQKTHGDYEDHARVTQRIKDIMQAERGWGGLTFSQRETLDMIAHKIGRVLAGNPNFHDHWHDIAGYSTLIANQLVPPPKKEK